jgi:hypothetical protein
MSEGELPEDIARDTKDFEYDLRLSRGFSKRESAHLWSDMGTDEKSDDNFIRAR